MSLFLSIGITNNTFVYSHQQIKTIIMSVLPSKTSKLVFELIKSQIANGETNIARDLYTENHYDDIKYANHMDMVRKIRNSSTWNELEQVFDELGMGLGEVIKMYLPLD